MSRLSPNVRPVILRSNSSSSSLTGMEIAAPQSPRRNRKSKKDIEEHVAKPLPPTPTLKVPSVASSRTSSIASGRTPSTGSLSSVYAEENPQPQKYVPYRRETLLPPPQAMYEPATYRSSTSAVPDVLPSRPKPKRDASSQAVLQKSAAPKTGPPESIFSEWRAPRYEGQEEAQSKATLPVDLLAKRSRETQHIAQQHANDYKSLLPRASTFPIFEPEPGPEPESESEPDAEPYYDTFNSLPAPMSPRITDVVDETLLPRPLRMSTAQYSSTSNHFSSSSSEQLAPKQGNRESLKALAKKAFHSRKPSKEQKAQALEVGADSKLSSEASQIDEKDNNLSMTASERANIQRGIIDMYDTLTNLYDPTNKYASLIETTPSSRPKPKIEFPPPKKGVLHKEHGSPAIVVTPHLSNSYISNETLESPSLTPYPKSADESWSKYSPTGSTPKKSHFSMSSKASSSEGSQSGFPRAAKKKLKSYTFPQSNRSGSKKRAKGVKWKKAVGFDRKKGKKIEGEKRRESIKKRIVVVRPLTEESF